jgi:O-antigen ligase
MNRKNKLLTEILLFLIALSFLFSSYGLKIFNLNFSFTMIIFIIIIVINLHKILKNGLHFSSIDFFVFLFLISTLLSLLIAENHSFQTPIKYIVLIIFFISLKELFIINPKYLSKIFNYLFYLMPIYLLFLIYLYLFIFNRTYIAPTLEFPTEAGKNGLAFLIILVIPFSLYKFKNSTRKVTDFVFLLILFLGVYFIKSRGLYLFSILTIAINFLLYSKYGILKKLLFSTIIFTLTIYFINFINIDIAFDTSINERYLLIKESLNIFYNSPFFGIGTDEFVNQSFLGLTTHNDYLLILVEQGLFGFIIFINILIINVITARKNFINKSYMSHSIYLLTIIIVLYMLIINVFANFYIWLLFAIISSANHLVKLKGVKLNENK